MREHGLAQLERNRRRTARPTSERRSRADRRRFRSSSPGPQYAPRPVDHQCRDDRLTLPAVATPSMIRPRIDRSTVTCVIADDHPRIVDAAPRTAGLLYSGFSERGLGLDALDAGARGFALKEGPLDDLVRATDAVAGGSLYIDPVVAGMLAGAGGAARRNPLSPREREVLRELPEGCSYGEIGSKLHFSPETVLAHPHTALTTLG